MLSHILLLYILTPNHRPHQGLPHLRIKSFLIIKITRQKSFYLRVKFIYLRVTIGKDYPGIQRLKKDGLNWH